MKLTKRSDGWWITNIPDCDDCGPYDTRVEAKEDKDGIQTTFDNWDDPTYWTSDMITPMAMYLNTPNEHKTRSDKGKTRCK